MNLDKYTERKAQEYQQRPRGGTVNDYTLLKLLIKEVARDQRYGDIEAINALEYEGDSLRHKDTFDEALNRAARAVMNAEPDFSPEGEKGE